MRYDSPARIVSNSYTEARQRSDLFSDAKACLLKLRALRPGFRLESLVPNYDSALYSRFIKRLAHPALLLQSIHGTSQRRYWSPVQLYRLVGSDTPLPLSVQYPACVNTGT